MKQLMKTRSLNTCSPKCTFHRPLRAWRTSFCPMGLIQACLRFPGTLQEILPTRTIMGIFQRNLRKQRSGIGLSRLEEKEFHLTKSNSASVDLRVPENLLLQRHRKSHAWGATSFTSCRYFILRKSRLMRYSASVQLNLRQRYLIIPAA